MSDKDVPKIQIVDHEGEVVAWKPILPGWGPSIRWEANRVVCVEAVHVVLPPYELVWKIPHTRLLSGEMFEWTKPFEVWQ